MKKVISEALSEIHNVTWPTKKHAIKISKITIGFTLASAVFMWVSDWLLSSAYKWLKSLNPKLEEVANENIPFPTGSWADLDWDSLVLSGSSLTKDDITRNLMEKLAEDERLKKEAEANWDAPEEAE